MTAVTPRTRAELGKSAAERGKRCERDVVRWLRDHGHPGAERTVRTGYATRDRTRPDTGDIDGCPGLVIQCKDVNAARAQWEIPAWLADTDTQRQAAGADIGILIVKRRGTASPGRWWAWTYLDQLAACTLAPVPAYLWHVPVQLATEHLIGILRRAGYGTPAGAS